MYISPEDKELTRNDKVCIKYFFKKYRFGGGGGGVYKLIIPFWKFYFMTFLVYLMCPFT